MSDAAYYANAGLPFRSIHGTLNHLLLAERLWLERLTGQSGNNGHLALLEHWRQADLYSTKDSTSIYWEEYVKDRNELGQALNEECRLYEEWVAKLPDQVSEEFSYDRKGVLITKPLVETLMHIVNHGTHHRGQISAAVFAAGLPPPVLDMLYYEN
ncbi:hypothetical protein BCR33DRAFT_785770 [Rhizoclosmatium globosum]|uniref:Damage-inducible protein DinB n=1 Tax=Rhizoclosmatium globosum TaxID=329046 RepID=A0A1Y2C8Y8_9FUNG|nr:hypothetical protein HDU79_004183 [Rhizoclosmatium sp. JEL0117]ORY43406.1 hypothetical protein BCR33DRAFT_785770 [Rhizoclosmatium globosum]|eukprot:ORY43406.1 hypothetical protein BCR33DRAFT_785770 [Rhizoclosmatium globosum]